jgi:hypothetical protein
MEGMRSLKQNSSFYQESYLIQSDIYRDPSFDLNLEMSSSGLTFIGPLLSSAIDITAVF